MGSKILFSHGLTNKCGVAILTPPNTDFKVIDTIRDNEGRFLKNSIEINDTLFLFHQHLCTNKRSQTRTKQIPLIPFAPSN